MVKVQPAQTAPRAKPHLWSSAPLPLWLLTALLLSVCLTARATAAPTSIPSKPSHSQVLSSPFGLTEIGLLDGAAYRIDIPPAWNRSLVVFYHGYARQPVSFHLAERLGPLQQPFLERHYAVAQSAYSQTGWALPQAFPETEALRRYFVKKYGQPRESFVAGRSMGGELVSITLELNPKPYLGGLDLCGSVGPAFESFERRFALRAAFDHYFPSIMPPLVPVPENFEDSPAARDKVLAALRANPAAAILMRNLTGLHGDADLAHDIPYWTFVLADMQRRAGGNPFDNRNTVYTGVSPTSSSADAELNENVKRYTAAPRARAYLMRHYTPSGYLGRPMLALHTIYDPIVPAATLELYDHLVQAAGAGPNLVQQIVDRDGHCNFTQDEVGDAFDDLTRWTHGGPTPTPGMQK